LNQHHIHAVGRSISLLESGHKEVVEPKFHRALDRDIKLMSQVKSILWEIWRNPMMPNLLVSCDDPHPVINAIDEEPNGAF
ncbi:MAG: hypothetical protein WBB22_16230, partial [Anaerolineae bacterium]